MTPCAPGRDAHARGRGARQRRARRAACSSASSTSSSRSASSIIALKFLLRILLVLSGHIRRRPRGRTRRRRADARDRSVTRPRRRRRRHERRSGQRRRRSRRGAQVGLGIARRRRRQRSASSAASSRRWSSLLALLGTPLFAIMGGSAEILWLLAPRRGVPPPALHRADRARRALRRLAHPRHDPALHVRRLRAGRGEDARPPRRAARTVLGWMPGGLAIVCIIASAFFTVLTGGSGVTIIAIGGLLYPALRKQRYSDAFSLGLVTTGGSVGLLLPPSLPLLVYALVAHVDFNEAFKAVLVPGLLVIVLLSVYAAYVGATREDRPRARRELSHDDGRASGSSSGSSASRSSSASASAPALTRSTRPRASSPSTSSSSSSSSTATSPGRRTSSASRRRR